MCKLIIIPNATKLLNIEEFSSQCAEILSDQRDGYGYAVQGANGVFGAKTLSPEAYAYNAECPPYIEPLSTPFGVPGQVTGSAMFHGRVSTNTVSIVNTHPIIRDDHYLVHNGVVTNQGDKYAKLTSNDSEDILYHLVSGGIDKVAANLTGYYAVGVFSPDGRLHVFKDATAPLLYAYSETLDTPIFASNQAILDALGELLSETFKGVSVKSDTYLVFEGKTLVSHSTFKSRGFEYSEAAWAEKSLGYSIEKTDLEHVTEAYLSEIEFLDYSYEITYFNKFITVEDFTRLPIEEQLTCDIRRHDGTYLNPWYDDRDLSCESVDLN